ncbi:melatonin receptor type 1B-B-like [Ptychodera flava]|uniref:melatonin receptor type 1B-B-like n=1 Tax=Ptychodera flava TaxID=63121 RepID=UPI003969E921
MNDTNTTRNQHHTWSTDDVPGYWVTQLCGTVELLFAVGALIGNTLVILIVIFKKKLRTWMNVFLVNLSITDIIAALSLCLPMSYTFYRRQWHFGSMYCLIHNLLHPFMMSTSLWLTAFISINRYVFIVFNTRYQRLTSSITVSLAIAFAWGTPVVLLYTVYQDTSLSFYDPSILRCRMRGTPFIVMFLAFAPTFLVLLSYILIIAYVMHSRRRVQAHAATQPQSSNLSSGPSPQELRMLFTIFAVFALILLFYLPYAIIVLVSSIGEQRQLPESAVLAYPLIHIGGAINPLLYGANNRHFKEAYKELLTGRLIRCSYLWSKNQVVPTQAIDLRIPGNNAVNDSLPGTNNSANV